jgi:hypothetical protein
MGLFERSEGKTPRERPRHSWEYNIKIYLREKGIDWVNWTQLAHDTVQWRASANTVMKLRVA